MDSSLINKKMDNAISFFEKELSQSITALRNYEKIAKNFNRNQFLKSYKLMKTHIEETIKNDNLQ